MRCNMNLRHSATVFLLSFAVFFLAGCRHKPESTTALENAAVAFQQAESPPPKPVITSPSMQTTAPSPSQELKLAQTAFQSRDFEQAAVRLQKLRAMPVLSPQQRIAVNDAIAAVMSEITTLAANGDARAAQALKTYERLQTDRR